MSSEHEKALLKNIKDKTDMALMEEGLKDNQMEFEFEGQRYRVVKPSFKHKQEVYNKQSEKFFELLNDSKYQLEDILIKKLKDKGVDLEEMERQIRTIDVKKSDLMFKLGEMIKENKGSEADRSTLERSIRDYTEEQQVIVLKRAKYLEYSIENQCTVFSYTYLGYVITEKFVDDNWVKAFASYDEMLASDERLVNGISLRAVLIGQNELQ